MITKKEIEYLAKLARIELAEEEKEKIAHDMASVILYIKKLEEIDTGDVIPTAHASDIVNNVRNDAPENEGSPAEIHERDLLLDSFPERDGDHLKIKEIFS